MADAIHYLAYGSNLHPHRLFARDVQPRLVGIVELPDRALVFHKRGKDGSGKGTLYRRAGGQVFGAVYEIFADEKAALDRIEGLGQGYELEHIQMTVNAEPFDAITYLASVSHLASGLRPFHWYKDMVLLGCEYHRFPRHYIAAIESVASEQDPDIARRRRNERLLAAMRDQIA